MSERHDAPGAPDQPDATSATGATDAPDRTLLLSGDAAADRLGVSRRTLIRYGERFGLWPVHRDRGRDQTPWYDPRDVERARELRAMRDRRAREAGQDTRARHVSRDDATTRDTGHVAAVGPVMPSDLAPVVARLAAELTRPLGEQIERLARENADLHRRAEAAERERDELRAQLEAAQAAPAATEAATIVVVEGDSHAPPPPLWRRLLRGLRGR
ncbi:MAG: helix-turn-helix domain-containing protein [Chloroflexota bacterium]|nr:helix-turn-helix domain-containing protein [Chloroflexota bacterium]